jgi:hypothetical protein
MDIIYLHRTLNPYLTSDIPIITSEIVATLSSALSHIRHKMLSLAGKSRGAGAMELRTSVHATRKLHSRKARHGFKVVILGQRYHTKFTIYFLLTMQLRSLEFQGVGLFKNKGNMFVFSSMRILIQG